MHDDGCEKQGCSKGDAALKNGNDGGEDERGGDGAGMEILVEDVERGTGDGHGEEDADESDAGPLSGGGGKAAAGNAPAAPQEKIRGEELAEEFGNGDGDVGEAHSRGHDAIEDAGLHLQGEEVEVVRVERGVQAALDGREVDGIVLDAWVISFDEQRRAGNHKKQGVIPD